MCQQCGNFNNWNWGAGRCGCGCGIKKGAKGERGIEGKALNLSNTPAFNFPLLTAAQIADYPYPSKGLMVYNTTTNQLYEYTTSWNPILSGVRGLNLFSTTTTRLGSSGSGTVTITTPFLPKLILATARNTNPAAYSGSFGRSNGTNNSCIYGKTLVVSNFAGLSQTSRDWFGMAAAPNGDVYACDPGSGDIYLQTGGVGNFVALGEASRFWYAMTAAPNGDIYAAEQGGDIYLQTGGVGSFIALSQTNRNWYAMAAAPNGDVYAADNSGDIYKQTGGVGNFIALGQTSRNWFGMAAASDGDVYACVNSGDIYKQTGGAGSFIALSQTSRSWAGMATAPNGDVYACVQNGDIYKQTGGVGNFVGLGQTHRGWYAMAAAPNGDVYASVTPGDIYKQSVTYVLIDNSSLNFSICDWQIGSPDNGFKAVINNFTATSFDIVYTSFGTPTDIVTQIDVIG